VTTFDDRENAFEAKFAHDAEMQFKAEARRNRMIGLWAAEILGKSEEDALEYAREIIRTDFKEAGPEVVIRKLAADLGERVTEADIRAKLAEFQAQAKVQLMNEA
jgi:hypothetical protein